MIKIDKEIINNMVEVYKLEKYLNIIVDYEKEDELTRKKRNLVTQFSNFYNTNTIDTLIQVINEIDNINNIEQLYIYEPDDIIDVFFDNSTFKNNIIQYMKKKNRYSIDTESMKYLSLFYSFTENA